MNGHFDPERFTLKDLHDAIIQTHDLPNPAPAMMSVETLRTVCRTAQVANIESERDMGFRAVMAWGIAIGVLAERNRLDRIKRR